MSYRNNLPNIVPGLPLGAALFTNYYVHLSGQMATAFRAATGGRYGLLSLTGESGIQLEVTTGALDIHHLSCISPAGDFVHLETAAGEEPFRVSLPPLRVGQSYRLRVVPAELPTIAYGPERNAPYRRDFLRPDHRFTIEEVQLGVEPPEAVNALDLVEILLHSNGSLVISNDFIPDCLQLNADARWKPLKKELQKLFVELMNHSTLVAQKSATLRTIAERQLHYFSLALSYELSAASTSYRSLGSTSHPAELLLPWERVAGLLHNFLQVTNAGIAQDVDALIRDNTMVAGFNNQYGPPSGVTRSELMSLAEGLMQRPIASQSSRVQTTLNFARQLRLLFSCLRNYHQHSYQGGPPTSPPGNKTSQIPSNSEPKKSTPF